MKKMTFAAVAALFTLFAPFAAQNVVAQQNTPAAACACGNKCTCDKCTCGSEKCCGDKCECSACADSGCCSTR